MKLDVLRYNSGTAKLRVARIMVLTSLGLLLAVLAAMHYLSALLLLPFAYGVVKQDWRTHIWLCFLLLFYFLFTVNSLAGTPTWLDYSEAMLIVTLFISAMLYCRWSKESQIITNATET